MTPLGKVNIDKILNIEISTCKTTSISKCGVHEITGNEAKRKKTEKKTTVFCNVSNHLLNFNQNYGRHPTESDHAEQFNPSCCCRQTELPLPENTNWCR